jgi:mono/diheme cytochrome c family protein
MTIAILIALVLVVLALFWYVLAATIADAGPSRSNQSLKQNLNDELEALYSQLAELEAEFARGEWPERDYQRLKLRDQTRAALVLKQLENLPSITPPAVAKRAVWPLALGLLLFLAVGGALANVYWVPEIELWGLKAEEAKTMRAYRELDRLENQLVAEAKASAGKGPSGASLRYFANKAWEAKAYERAAAAYIDLIKQDPKDALSIARFGAILFFSGENDDAEKLLKRSIEIKPSADAYLNLGNLLFAVRKDPKGAIAAWEDYQKLLGDKSAGRVADLIAAARNQLGASDPGAKLFAQNCASCHGAEAQGIIGPKLLGRFQARDVAFVRNQIQKGSPGKMPAQPQVQGLELEQLASFVSRLARSEEFPQDSGAKTGNETVPNTTKPTSPTPPTPPAANPNVRIQR